MNRPKTHPPRWANWLLEWFCDDHQIEILQGDLYELFEKRMELKGSFRAKIYFVLDVLGVLRPFARKRKRSTHYNLFDMLRNYLTITYRNIRSQKTYSFINAAGLAIGLACFILIFLYIQDELSFDRMHEKSDRIYRLHERFQSDGIGEHSASQPFPVAPTLLNDCAHLMDYAVRMFNFQSPTLAMANRDQDKAFNETRVFFVDSTFLEVFDFGIIAGNRSTALDEPNSILLTRSMAQKYFGHEDPMGKLLEFQGHHNYRVTGVLEDAPLNAHFQFDFLVSFSSLKSFYSGSYPRNWYWNPCWTYVVLKDGVNTDEVEQVFPEFVDKYFPDFVKEDITLGLQPVTDIHLHSKLDYEIQANSNIINIYIFSAVALLVLLVATINFVNLSTARASKRAKEVGVRKALGSSRKLLFYQFIFESFLFTCISVSIAIGLALWSIPYFNRLTEKSISLQELLSGDMLTMLSLLILAVGILSGIYPAVILSSFRPLTVLRSLKTGVKGLVFRRALVTIQFGISIILIIGTVFSVMQLQLLQNDDVGFDKEYVIMVPVIRSPMGQHYEAFKDETLKHPSVISMTAVEEIVGSKHQVANYRFGEMERSHPFPHFHVRHDFIETFNIPLAAGRTYDQSFVTDDSLALVVNEQLVASMGWSSAEEAIGKPFHFSRHRGHIVGVIKDFNFLSKHHSISPFVLNLDLNPRAFELFIKYVAIKLDGHNFVESVAHMKNSWKKFIPNRPFEYFFLDDKLAQSYKAEQNLSKVTIIFSVLAILVACLGLFGLATYSVEQRTKEIGIRKVLGIASSQILMLLSKEFMWLILLAFGLSAPLAYLLLDSWLDSFAYRITIVVWPFVSAGVLTFLVSMLTVSYHAYRASRINPVETLKYE